MLATPSEAEIPLPDADVLEKWKKQFKTPYTRMLSPRKMVSSQRGQKQLATIAIPTQIAIVWALKTEIPDASYDQLQAFYFKEILPYFVKQGFPTLAELS